VKIARRSLGTFFGEPPAAFLLLLLFFFLTLLPRFTAFVLLCLALLFKLLADFFFGFVRRFFEFSFQVCGDHRFQLQLQASQIASPFLLT
jgi:hypothetical protein